MFRPLRRVRERETNYVKAEVKGMLPEEELALRRALQASLVEEKTSPGKSKPQAKMLQEPPTGSSPLSSTCCDSVPVKGIRTETVDDPYEFPSPTSSSIASRSVSSTHDKTSGLVQSPLTSPAGSTGSVESSLRLVLSTSSRSTTSVSSNWSSAPSSPITPPSRTSSKGSPKSRRVTQTRASLQTKRTVCKPRKGMGKLAVNPSLFGEPSLLKVKTPPKKNLKSPGKAESLKTPPKSLEKSRKRKAVTSPTKLTGTKKSKLEIPDTVPTVSQENPLSPEAILVMHDHCYYATSSVKGQTNDVEAHGHKNGTNNSGKQPSEKDCKLRGSSGCIFQAQRKFTQNQVPSPPVKPQTNVVQSLRKLKEIPKTEDFITYLCMRGSHDLPRNFRKFNKPWTPLIKTKHGNRVSYHVKSMYGNSSKACRSRVSKKLKFQDSKPL